MDIAELIRGEEMTQKDWATKENQIQDDFVWGIGPEALYQMTRAEYKTEPEKIAIKDLLRLFNEYFLLKKKTHTTTAEKSSGPNKPKKDTRVLLAEIEKDCNLKK